jgi:hypothetical protein
MKQDRAAAIATLTANSQPYELVPRDQAMAQLACSSEP